MRNRPAAAAPALLILLASVTPAVVPARASAQAGDDLGTHQVPSLRVAVAPFSGGGARATTRDIRRALEELADVASSRESSAAAGEAGIDGLTGEIGAFASATGAELVFLGSVESAGGGRRRRRRASSRAVTISVFASDGEPVADASFSYQPGRRGRDALGQEISALYSRAVAGREAHLAPPEPEPVYEPEPDIEPEPEPEPDAPADGLAIISGWLGWTLRNRAAVVGLTGQPDRAYDAVFSEVGVAVEARPFARDGHLGRGLYVNADFWHSVGLQSVVDDGMGGGVVTDTNFARFGLNAGFLMAVIPEVEVGGGLGGGFEGYYFAPNPILPTVELGYIRVAGRGRIRLMQETVVLDLQLGYRGVVSLGPLAGAFGEGAEAHGVDLSATVTGNLSLLMELGFTWAAQLAYVGYFSGFSGPASDAQGTSGAEESVRFSLLAGWSF